MKTVVIEGELLGGDRNLLQITDAFDAARLFFRSSQSGQEQRSEGGNDANGDKQFYQRESPVAL